MLTTTLQTIWDLLPKDEDDEDKIDINSEAGILLTYWNALLKGLGKTKPDDEPITLLQIFENCGMKCAIRSTDAFPPGRTRAFRLYACYCARYVIHFFEEDCAENKSGFDEHREGGCPAKEAPRQVIEAAEKFAYGFGSREEMFDVWRRGSCPVVGRRVEGCGSANAADAAITAVSYVGRHELDTDFWDFLRMFPVNIGDITIGAYFYALEALDHAAWSPAGEATEFKCREELRLEFIRLCKLEGEYGEVDKLDNP